MPDGTVAEYGYGPLGRRVEKRVGGEVRRYFYDGEDIVAEYGGGGGLAARYTHGPGIDEPLAMERGGRTYYYHADALGSIKAITNGAGSVVQRYSYDAFGGMAYVENPLFVQPYAYTGREQDPESGLYNYRARYYDSGVGRFLSEDPIGIAGGDVNLYRYVGNNPVSFTDPWGLWDVMWSSTLGGADFSTTIYDTNLGWVPYSKPDVGVSTTLVGAGVSIGFDGFEPDPKWHDSELMVSVGYGKYLGVSLKPDLSKWRINIGYAIATRISFSTSIENFGKSLGEGINGAVNTIRGKNAKCEK